MSALDLRGFRHALDPLTRRQRWTLEARQLELAAAGAELARADAARLRLRQDYEQGADQALRRCATRIDPAAHARTLGYLAGLRERMLVAWREVERLRARRQELLDDCIALQRRLDVLERHRDEAKADFASTELRRQSAEMDREWVARNAGRAGWAETPLEQEPT